MSFEANVVFTLSSRDKDFVCTVHESDSFSTLLRPAANEWLIRRIGTRASFPWPWPGGPYDSGFRSGIALPDSSSRSSSLRSGSPSSGPTFSQTPACCWPWRCRESRWPSWWSSGCKTDCGADSGWICKAEEEGFWARAFSDDPVYPWLHFQAQVEAKQLQKSKTI